MIVNSVAYRGGAKIADVTLDDISEVLKERDTFIWLGLYEPDIDLLRKVQEEFSLHDLAIEDALNAHQRPKCENYNNSMFVVLNTVQLIGDDIAFGETHVFVGRNFIITIRHGASLPYSGLRHKAEASPMQLAKGPVYVLYALFDFVIDHFQDISEELQTRFEDLESKIFNDKFDRAAIEQLYRLKSQLLRVRAAVAPAEDICTQLIRLHESLVPVELRDYFRDIEDHVTRIVNVLDVIREMITTAIQVNLALVTVSQNEIVKRLAGWGAVLAIPTVVFSLYGMNFTNMPELKLPYAYPVVVAATASACIALYLKLRRSGWV
jgi:magnesium transporter